jgi:adenylate cyclase
VRRPGLPSTNRSRANNDEVGYREFADCYRKRANDVGYEGHMALAEEMVKAR